MICAEKIEFSDLANLEPKLADLMAEAQGHHRNTPANFCRIRCWYGKNEFAPGLRSRLRLLVGWAVPRSRGILAGERAYSRAYRAIYDALPPCKPGCWCSVMLDVAVGVEVDE